jgi:hypothetical protein
MNRVNDILRLLTRCAFHRFIARFLFRIANMDESVFAIAPWKISPEIHYLKYEIESPLS